MGGGQLRKQTGVFTSPRAWWQAGSLCGMGQGVCPGVRPKRWLREFAHPSGDACRGQAQYPAFAPNPLLVLQALQKWQLGAFGLFVSFGSGICPNCTRMLLFLVPVSLHFVAQGEVCTGANTAATWSQVPVYLITTKNKIILSGDRGINQPYCVNISQCIHISNHHILHLKLQFYMSIMSQ